MTAAIFQMPLGGNKTDITYEFGVDTGDTIAAHVADGNAAIIVNLDVGVLQSGQFYVPIKELGDELLKNNGSYSEMSVTEAALCACFYKNPKLTAVYSEIAPGAAAIAVHFTTGDMLFTVVRPPVEKRADGLAYVANDNLSTFILETF